MTGTKQSWDSFRSYLVVWNDKNFVAKQGNYSNLNKAMKCLFFSFSYNI